MKCEEMETRLVGYMDGRATAAERAEAETHLAACAACRARMEEFGRLWGVLDEAPGIEVSPAFDARLRSRIAAEPARGMGWIGWLIPQPRLALAMSLLLALGVWIATIPPTPGNRGSEVAQDEEFQMIKNLPVLEDLDVLANFEALSEVPAPQAQPAHKM